MGDLNISILLVEDHADTLRVMTRLLKELGCSVKAASCVAEAMKIVDGEPLHLLICDLNLPDGHGSEVLGKLQARGVKGISLSGMSSNEAFNSNPNVKFDRHLTKPVDFNQLEQTIQELCG